MSMEQTHTSIDESRSVSGTDNGLDVIEPVPPFQGTKEDKVLTRKRQALFLRQTLSIAERFSQNPVTPSMLAAALPWLEREQYDNIAIERNAHGNCGYILCQKPQGTSVNQVYRISSNRRRVYDATARKPFCSDWCYRAFQHIRKQVSPEPGWCRFVSGTQEPSTLSVLPANASGRPGKLVLDALQRLRLDDDCSPVGSSAGDSDSDSEPHSESSGNYSDPSDSPESNRFEILDSDDDDDVPPTEYKSHSKNPPLETSWGKEVKVPTRNLVIERSTDHQSDPLPTSVTVTPDSHMVTPPVDVNPLHYVAMRLHQWLSPRALAVLSCVELTDNCLSHVDSHQSVDTSEPTRKELAELPDALSSGARRAEDPLPPGVLPLIDSVSSETMRKHLFMEAIGPRVKSLLLRFGIASQRILSKLDSAVVHFRLTSKNLYLNPVQRAITSLALLRIMAPTEPTLSPFLSESDLKTVMLSICDVSVDEFIESVVRPFLTSM